MPFQAQSAELQESFSTHEAIKSTSRLFVRNLVFSCTEDELRRRFEEYGPVEQVRAQVFVFRVGPGDQSRMINSIGTTDS